MATYVKLQNFTILHDSQEYDEPKFTEINLKLLMNKR